ncbi:MAG: hypothetical protein M5U26_23435 [Planctomycetota bacterium]|nr:hypothetical protein [Planctomycetota bacterium]
MPPPDGESWYLIEKTYEVVGQGLLLVGAAETAPDFEVHERDIVQIVKPDGGMRRTCVLEIYPSETRPVGDLLVDGLASADVPAGSRLKVVSPAKRRERRDRKEGKERRREE